MQGQYITLSKTSTFGDVPSTFNTNFDTTKSNLDYIFDSDNNYLKRSLRNDKGFVKAHWGEFVNLKVASIQFTGSSQQISSLSDTSYIDHPDILKRFSWDYDTLPLLNDSEILNYAHDTDMIITNPTSDSPITIGDKVYTSPMTLRTELNQLESVVTDIAKNISIKNNSDEVTEDLLGTDSDVDYIEVEENEDSSTVVMSFDDFLALQNYFVDKITSLESKIEELEIKLESLK